MTTGWVLPLCPGVPMKDDDDTCDRGLDPTPHNLWCCALCDAENRVTGFELCKVCLTYAQEDALAAAQDRDDKEENA